jgi:hypothetical protein
MDGLQIQLARYASDVTEQTRLQAVATMYSLTPEDYNIASAVLHRMMMRESKNISLAQSFRSRWNWWVSLNF